MSPDEQWAAVVRLITAQSIEFYAKRYNDRWGGTATTESVLGLARAAIAKAEGRGT